MVCVKTYKKTIKNCRCRCRKVKRKPVKKSRRNYVTDVVASSLKGLEHFGLTKKKKKR